MKLKKILIISILLLLPAFLKPLEGTQEWGQGEWGQYNEQQNNEGYQQENQQEQADKPEWTEQNWGKYNSLKEKIKKAEGYRGKDAQSLLNPNADFTKARDLLLEVANQPDFPSLKEDAYRQLALFYLMGLGKIPFDLNLAEKYIQKAAKEAKNAPQILFFEVLIKAIKNKDLAKLEEIKKGMGNDKDGKLIEEIFIDTPLKKWQEITSKKGGASGKVAGTTKVVDPKKQADLKKLKAAQALQAKKFKDISDKLAKYANVIQQFKAAQQNKNNKKIKQLQPKVNKIKQALKKTNIHIKNSNGQTPIMVNLKIAPIVYAVDKKRAKAMVNAKDKKGKTVMQYLITSKQFDKPYIYKALVNGGARVTDQDIKAAKNKLKAKPQVAKTVVVVLQQGKKNR